MNPEDYVFASKRVGVFMVRNMLLIYIYIY